MFGFLEDSQNLNKNGIGLGLVISDNIVNQYGGKITFESEIEKGSTFSFTIKLPNADDENDEDDSDEASVQEYQHDTN